MNYWSIRVRISAKRFISGIGIGASKFYDWKRRYGKVNEHNSWIPRDFWLEDWEKKAIEAYYLSHREDGYRRLTYMMLDEDVVSVSASSVYRVLKERGYLHKWSKRSSSKGNGFRAPETAHEHWHIDISYVNIKGTFYYLCSILDGYSRYIVHWELRESMRERDVEIVLQRALEQYPGKKTRIISDNGPQFIAKDFKEFIRISGMDHVKTSPYYPESNGKIERWHQSVKKECIRPKCPVSYEEVKKVVRDFVCYYNNVRLHSSIGYIAPYNKLYGNEKRIFEQRDRRLEEARAKRRENRKKAKQINVSKQKGSY